MYAKMEPAFRDAGITVHVLFYVVVILLAGYLYDRLGRRIVSIMGLVFLALSYLLFTKKMLLSAYLIQSSYGFVDVFSMIIWAELARYGAEGKHYAIGYSLILIMLSLLIGYKTIMWFSPAIFDFEAIALLLLLLASISIAVVKEPALSEEEYALKVVGMGVFHNESSELPLF